MPGHSIASLSANVQRQMEALDEDGAEPAGDAQTESWLVEACARHT